MACSQSPFLLTFAVWTPAISLSCCWCILGLSIAVKEEHVPTQGVFLMFIEPFVKCNSWRKQCGSDFSINYMSKTHSSSCNTWGWMSWNAGTPRMMKIQNWAVFLHSVLAQPAAGCIRAVILEWGLCWAVVEAREKAGFKYTSLSKNSVQAPLERKEDYILCLWDFTETAEQARNPSPRLNEECTEP